MQVVSNLPYRKQVFVCVNSRPDRSCCANVCGEEIAQALKDWVKSSNLSDIRITKSKCLGYCNDIGANMVIYPDKKWILQTRKEDLEQVKKEIMKESF